MQYAIASPDVAHASISSSISLSSNDGHVKRKKGTFILFT